MIRSYKNPLVIFVIILFCWAFAQLCLGFIPSQASLDSMIFGLFCIGVTVWCAWYVFSYKELDELTLRTKLLWFEVNHINIKSITKIYQVDYSLYGGSFITTWAIESDDNGTRKRMRVTTLETNKDRLFKRIIDMCPGQIEVDAAVFDRLQKIKTKGN